MSIWNLFSRGPSLEEGITLFRETPGALLLDVRSPQEFASGHVPGAQNLPVERIHTISCPKETPLFVYCYSGARSGEACRWLAGNGYSATNIGGIGSYHDPLES